MDVWSLIWKIYEESWFATYGFANPTINTLKLT